MKLSDLISDEELVREFELDKMERLAPERTVQESIEFNREILKEFPTVAAALRQLAEDSGEIDPESIAAAFRATVHLINRAMTAKFYGGFVYSEIKENTNIKRFS